MSATTDIELKNTRAKLAMFESHYEARCKQPVQDPKLREVSLRSVKRTINQLTEEIARLECGLPARPLPTLLGSEQEVQNTRAKLRMFEEQYARNRRETDEDERLYRATRRSLKGVINQLTEEIARYEAHCRVGRKRSAKVEREVA